MIALGFGIVINSLATISEMNRTDRFIRSFNIARDRLETKM
jgi:hypothetical protein